MYSKCTFYKLLASANIRQMHSTTGESACTLHTGNNNKGATITHQIYNIDQITLNICNYMRSKEKEKKRHINAFGVVEPESEPEHAHKI